MTVALADTVGTLRIRTSHDEPAVRSAVAGAVRRAHLHPSGRSPRAVLVVRRLEHRIAWEPGMPAPTGPAAPDLARDIDAMWRLAGRPADGRVPATAPAVLFADLVELVALFCEDVAVGTVGQRWWWDVVRRALAPAARVAEALQRHPAIAPAVVAELDRRGTTAAVLDAVTEREAADLTIAVAAAHGAPRVTQHVRRSIAHASVDPGRPRAASPRRAGIGGPPEQPERPDARRLFAAVARLAAAGDPRLRSAAFADRIGRGLEPDLAAEEPVAPPIDAADDPHSVAADAPWSTGRPAVRRAVDRIAARTERRRAADGERGEPLGTVGDEASDDPTTLDVPALAAAGSDRDPGPSGRGPDVADSPSATRSEIADRAAVAPPGPTGVVTGLGGVFFLVDVMRELDLPDVFEDRWQLASRLGGWGTLEVLARSLVPAIPPWPHDHIWRLLADLAGGAGALAPERALPARVRRRLPPAWQQLRLPHAEPPSVVGSLASDATQGLRRWLELVRPFVVDLLVERVGVGPEDLLDAVLARSARIDVDRTHVDVVMPLSSATVPVRRAGLDRDAGWVPQLGRVLLFHFDTEAAGL